MGYLTVTRLIAMIAPRLHSTGAVWLAGTEQAEFRRRGREVEGTPLLREHLGQNLDRGFESLRLRQQWWWNPKRSRPLGVLFFLAANFWLSNISVPEKSAWIALTSQPPEASVADEVPGRPERGRI